MRKKILTAIDLVYSWLEIAKPDKLLKIVNSYFGANSSLAKAQDLI